MSQPSTTTVVTSKPCPPSIRPGFQAVCSMPPIGDLRILGEQWRRQQTKPAPSPSPTPSAPLLLWVTTHRGVSSWVTPEELTSMCRQASANRTGYPKSGTGPTPSTR